MSVDILGTNCDQCLSMVHCCFTSTETIRLNGRRREGGMEAGEVGDYIPIATLSCIKMGSDESHFNVSLIVKDKVTTQCSQTTTFEENGESKWYRTEVLLLTSLTPRIYFLFFRWCLMSSDVCWHIIRDKLRPMRDHGSILLHVHGNHEAR